MANHYVKMALIFKCRCIDRDRLRSPRLIEAFGAAGIEGLQLVFYPSGYCGATEGVLSRTFRQVPAGPSTHGCIFLGVSDYLWVFVDISRFKKGAYSDKTVVRLLLRHL